VLELAESLEHITKMKKNLKPPVAAFIALLFYTITDILVWQRIFETNQMIEYAHVYHRGWFVSLFGYAILGIILLWGVLKDCIYFLIALTVSAFSGLEDVLYYVLDGKPVPHALPWLENHPLIFETSRAGVIGSALFWIICLAILYVLLYWRRTPTITVIESTPINIPELEQRPIPQEVR
jgi:hypothetical protein